VKIMVIGQKWFGAEVFKLCRRLGHATPCVCAPRFASEEFPRPDRLFEAASQAGVPVLASYGPECLQAEMIVEGLDLIIAAHAHIYLRPDMRGRAVHGAIGYHPSLLPRHRGRDAVRWAIAMGERVTGGTVYRMTDRPDAGPILAQDWCFIRPHDSPADLWRRELAPLGLRLLEGMLFDPMTALALALPQDESLATWEPAFSRPRLATQIPPK
jgi:methionyl-tRNA formyltransferase